MTTVLPSDAQLSQLFIKHKLNEIDLTKSTKWTIAIKIGEEIIHINECAFSKFSPIIASLNDEKSEERKENLPVFPGTKDTWQWLSAWCELGFFPTIASGDRGLLVYVMEFLQFPQEIVSLVISSILSSEKNIRGEKWGLLPAVYHAQVLDAYATVVVEKRDLPSQYDLARVSLHVVKRNLLAFKICKFHKLDTEYAFIKAVEKADQANRKK